MHQTISRIRLFFVAATFVALAGFSLTLASQADAATPNPGITVTPAKLSFILSKDAPSQKITITITNNYDSALVLAAEFKGIDENAGLLVPTDKLDKPFVSSLILSETSLQLAPHVTRQLTVQLNNNSALAPGGHYATLVLTQQAAPTQKLSLRAAISLTVFGIKTEGEVQKLSLTAAGTNHWLFHLPSKATLTYRNSGNVHVVPRASVFIPQPHSDQPLLKGISNANSLPLLPGKTYTDTVTLERLASVWLPRRLQLVVAYRIDGAARPAVQTQKFWYIPPWYPLLLLLIAVLFASRYRKRAVAERKVELLPAEAPVTMIRPSVEQRRIDHAPVNPNEPVLVNIEVKSSTPLQLKPARSAKPRSAKKPTAKAKKKTTTHGTGPQSKPKPKKSKS